MGRLHPPPLTATRRAAIDIGTNTILMVIADVGDDGRMTVLHDVQRIVRLGGGVDGFRLIPPEAADRCAAVLTEYAAIAGDHGATHITAVATSAVRDAENRSAFLKAMQRRTGVIIRPISGVEEARLTHAGVVSGLPHGGTRRAVIDVGGGSTEIMVETMDGLLAIVSRDIGSVRLSERLGLTQPPNPDDVAALRHIVRSDLTFTLPLDPAATTVMAVAGTALTLAALDLGLPGIDSSVLAGHRLPLPRISDLTGFLLRTPAEVLVSRHGIAPGRADIIATGAIILEELMLHFRIGEILVSERGLRHGLLLSTEFKG